MKKIFRLTILFILAQNCFLGQPPQAESMIRQQIDSLPYVKCGGSTLEKGNNFFQTQACFFSDPDTSVSNIKIRNAESVLKVLGADIKLEGDSTHLFYSNNGKQKLGLKVYPGDYVNQVSVFSISYTNDSKHNFRQVNVKEFETEKGIKLGLSKTQIIKKLGLCYISKDSTTSSVVLYYSITLSKDSKTKLLRTNNLPTYYAIYRLKKDRLDSMEFGFEYP